MWSDTESDKDYLNFGEVSQLAVDILSSHNMLPVSIGVFGNWGAGKSSLLKLIENKLLSEKDKYVVIKFDAWLYQGYDDARAAFLEVIVTGLNKIAKDNTKISERIKGLFARIDAFRVLCLAAEGGALLAGLPTFGVLSRSIETFGGLTDGIQNKEEYKQIVDSGKEVKEQISGLVNPEVQKTPPQQIDSFREDYGKILKELSIPLVVIIDNLDRCLPANAIQTLEAIRLFLFLNNTAFIIAADEDMIRASVAKYFEGASNRHQIDYLDKLIQVPIGVPKAGVREIRSYLFMLYAIDHKLPEEKLEKLRERLEKSLQESWKEEPITRQEVLAFTGESEESPLGRSFERADRISPLLANSPIIHGNPRIVKRLLNVIKMRSQIANRRGMPLDEAVITKLVIFERCAGMKATEDFYQMMDKEKGKPQILKKLEGKDDRNVFDEAPESWFKDPTIKEFILEWGKLSPSLCDVDLRAAIYLSRETLPIGAYVIGLSSFGHEALKILIDTENISSPAGKKVVDELPVKEHVPVMEGVISHLRKISNWKKKPKGFAGACLLAQHSSDAARILGHYISGIRFGEKQPIWLKTLLKDEQWYKES